MEKIENIYDPLAITSDSKVGGGIFDSAALPNQEMGVKELKDDEAKTEEKTQDSAKEVERTELEAEDKAKEESKENDELKGDELKAESPKETLPKGETLPRLFAGKFKTPEQLETAYAHSSKEGVRLNNQVIEAQKQVKQLEDQLFQVKLESEIGQFNEISKEDYAELDETQKRVYNLEKSRFIDKKERLERMRSDNKQNESRLVDNELRELETQADYQELDPIMNELMDRFSWIETNPKHGIATLVYLAASELKNRHLRTLSDKATKSSKEDAKLKAESDAARIAVTGNGNKVTVPSKEKAGELDEFNASILSAGPRNLF